MTAKYHVSAESVDYGKHGKIFERDLSELLFKRTLSANFKDFLFTREKRGVGKFDDIIIILERNYQEKEILLAQLKHLQNQSTEIGYEELVENKKSYFFLPKYYEYFLESRKDIREYDEFKNAKLKSLFLCTNVNLKSDLGKLSKQTVTNDELFKKTGLLSKVKIPNDLKRKIFSQNYLTTRQKLANELVERLMVNTHIDITSMIKNEEASLLKDYHSALVEYVIDPETKGLKTEFLYASANEEVDELRKDFYTALSQFYSKYADYDENYLKREFSLNSQKVKDLMDRLEDYRTSEAVDMFLKKQKFDVKKNFFKGDMKPQTLPQNEHIFKDEIDREIDEFLDLLTFATNLCDVKSIAKMEMSPKIYSDFRDEFDQWFYFGGIKDNDIWHRKWLWKKELSIRAMKSSILFQGKEFEIQELIDDETCLTPDLLMRVFCSQSISVGQPPFQQSQTRHYYILRNLLRQSKDKEQRVISENDLIHNYSNKQKKLWLIVGEPGLGKTTYLQSIAKKFSEKSGNNGPMWIIRVPLNTCREALVDLKAKKLEAVIKFFANYEKCEEEFSTFLFEKFLKTEGKVKILLDGLDELHDVQQEKVITLVKVLKEETCVDQIWITARTHLQRKFRSHFKDNNIFTLQQLEDDQKVSMLVRYWVYASNQTDEIKLTDFARNLVQKINVSIDQKWQNFLGIPLQAYMVGFIFHEEIKNENPEIPNILTLASLYDEFVEEKYRVYFRKVGLDRREDWFKEKIKQNWNKCYQHLSLLYGGIIPLSREGMNFLLPSEEEKTALLTIGIIFQNENKFYFVHQTFAEYFAANLFADVCQNRHSCKQECISIVKDRIFPDVLDAHELFESKSFFRLLFDLKVAEDFPLHFAVLKGKKDEVERFNKEEINAKDCVGRTFLYYALCYVHYEILEILFEKNISVDLNDNFFIFYWVELLAFKCYMDKFQATFLNWNANDFSCLAARIKVSLYVCENETIIIEANSYNYEQMPYIHISNNVGTRKRILSIARQQIEDAKVILQELTSDFTEIELNSLSKEIEALKDKEIPLVEAHRYFEIKEDYLLNSDKNELGIFFENSDIQKHAEVLKKSTKTAYQVSERLFKACLTTFEVSDKRVFQILNEIKKRNNNCFLIFKEFTSWQIPICLYFYWKLDVIVKEWKALLDPFVNKIKNISEPLVSLNTKVQQGEITGWIAEVICDVWWAKDEYEIPDLNDKKIDLALTEVMEYVLRSVDVFQVLDLYEKIRHAISALDKSKLFSLLRKADEKGWLPLVLNITDKSGNTLEDVIRREKTYHYNIISIITINSISDLLIAVREKGSAALHDSKCLVS